MAKIKKRKKEEVDPVEKRFEKLERDFGKLKEKFEDLNDQVKLLESPNESPKTFLIPSGKGDPKIIEDFLKASKAGVSLGALGIQNQKPKSPEPLKEKTVCIKCKHVKRKVFDSYKCKANERYSNVDYTTEKIFKSLSDCADINDGDCKKFEQADKISIVGRCLDCFNKYPVVGFAILIITVVIFVGSAVATAQYFGVNFSRHSQ